MAKNHSPGRPMHPDILTPAEWRIVHLAQHGLTNAQIAQRANISINAVKYHITNAVGKLQVIKSSGVSNKKSLLKFMGAPKDSAFQQTITQEVHDMVKQDSIINSVGQISRTVNSIKQAENWYRDVLKLNHLYTYGQLAFFDVDGVRIMLSEGENQAASDESIIYFKTSDIKKTHQQLSNRGIEFTHAPHKVHTHDDGTEEWMAFFEDLEGRPLGLMGKYK